MFNIIFFYVTRGCELAEQLLSSSPDFKGYVFCFIVLFNIYSSYIHIVFIAYMLRSFDFNFYIFCLISIFCLHLPPLVVVDKICVQTVQIVSYKVIVFFLCCSVALRPPVRLTAVTFFSCRRVSGSSRSIWWMSSSVG